MSSNSTIDYSKLTTEEFFKLTLPEFNKVQHQCNMEEHEIRKSTSTDTTFTKIVNQRELKIYELASKHNIAPKMINVEQIIPSNSKQLYKLTTEKYPCTLMVCKDKDAIRNLKPKIIELLNSMHKLGIVHLDPSEENIVIDPVNMDIKIIDFGLSRMAADITYDEICDLLQEYTFVDNKHILTSDYTYDEGIDHIFNSEVCEFSYLVDHYSK